MVTKYTGTPEMVMMTLMRVAYGFSKTGSTTRSRQIEKNRIGSRMFTWLHKERYVGENKDDTCIVRNVIANNACGS